MRSGVQRLNPLVLLSFGFASLAGSFAVRDLPSALAATAAYGLSTLLLLPSWRYPLACLALCGVSAGLVAYSAWRLGNGDHAPVAALRILVLAWPGAVMVGFVDPARLGDYVAQRLHGPDRFVAAFVAALQRVSGLTATWQQLARVRRVRGLGPTRNPLVALRYAGSMTFALLADALRGASRTSIAMDARGFASAQHRTWAEPAPWARADTVGLALAVGLGAVAPITLALT